MANVNIKFNGKDYLLSCDDGQEESLIELANFLDNKYIQLRKNIGNIGEQKLLLITTIKIIDDFFDLKKKIDSKKIDFEKLSEKFKEIKSLAINYKDEKELEINTLKEQIAEFKSMVEENKNLYEEILDKTTKSIEEFIETAESKENLQ
tara:strand:+ start:74 stop:520 length:447 start_codon:yes stop_codon:yes gene_type:complete